MPRLNNKVLFIMFSGKAGVGKTTASDMLTSIMVEEGYIVKRESFARGVKSVASSLGWDGKKDQRGRGLLQKVGQLGRWYNPNIWVANTFNRLYESDFGIMPSDAVIIDDWRFPNEFEYVRDNEDLLFTPIRVRIEAPDREVLKGTPEYNEESEISLPSFDMQLGQYDYGINNSGILAKLNVNLGVLLDNLKRL